MMNVFLMTGMNFILVMALMVILWGVYLMLKRISVVDIGWALSLVICSTVYLTVGEGEWLRRWTIGLLALAWSARLAWYLISRFMGSAEDQRYAYFTDGWKTKGFNFKILAFFLLQGLLIIFLSFILIPPVINPDPRFTHWEIIGFIIVLVGIVGESYADLQLQIFKKNPAHIGKVCDRGLWRYSRHPNYFFEWLVWVGFCFYALGSPYGWMTIYAPVMMYFLLTRVSGIPLAERQAAQSREVEYQEYQNRTNAFFPWFN